MFGNLSDLVKEYGSQTEPSVSILIRGKKLQGRFLKLKSLEIDLSIDNSASVSLIKLEGNINQVPGNLNLNKEIGDVQIGAKIEIKLGYRSNGKILECTVFIGYVFSTEIEVFNDFQNLVISAMDGKMWLMTSQKTELKKDKKKYSDIVSQTLKSYSDKFVGTEVSISGEAQILYPICQREESDFDFLCRLSKITGCIFYVSLGKVFFTKSTKNISKSFTIEPSSVIRSVKHKTNILGIPKEIIIKKLDEGNYSKVIKVNTNAFDNIGSGKKAFEHTTNITTSNSINMLNNTAFTQDYAKFLAEGYYSDKNLNFVSCQIEMILLPKIELGTGVSLKKFGNPIENSYIIRGIKHEIKNNSSRTVLTLGASCFNPASGLDSIGNAASSAISAISSFF